VGLYRRRRPAETVLYQLVQEQLETFLALSEEGTGEGLPGYVERDFRKYLDCGILALGLARARCKDCGKDCGEDYLIAFSCKTRGACPSCNTRRMVEIAAHLSEAAILQVQERVRRRVLKAFVHRGLLEAGARDEMLAWQDGGGFSLDAAVRIAADDRDGLERLLHVRGVEVCLVVIAFMSERATRK
jgi:hypothetical protein